MSLGICFLTGFHHFQHRWEQRSWVGQPTCCRASRLPVGTCWPSVVWPGYRVTGLNLLAAIIIYWNTLKLGEAGFARKQAGLENPAEFLAHISPLGWEHINLTGEYRWPGADPRSGRRRLT